MIVDHEYKMNNKNNDTFWIDLIRKEMQNVGTYFKILDHNCYVPVVWKKVTGNMVFDVKMAFMRKARWVLYGHNILDK